MSNRFPLVIRGRVKDPTRTPPQRQVKLNEILSIQGPDAALGSSAVSTTRRWTLRYRDGFQITAVHSWLSWTAHVCVLRAAKLSARGVGAFAVALFGLKAHTPKALAFRPVFLGERSRGLKGRPQSVSIIDPIPILDSSASKCFRRRPTIETDSKSRCPPVRVGGCSRGSLVGQKGAVTETSQATVGSQGSLPSPRSAPRGAEYLS